MKRNKLMKTIGCIAASVAFGVLVQIFLPNVLITVLCCILIVVMGIVIAKLC